MGSGRGGGGTGGGRGEEEDTQARQDAETEGGVFLFAFFVLFGICPTFCVVSISH